MSNIEINDNLLIRTWLNENPAETLFIAFGLVIFLSSYCVYVFERKNSFLKYLNGKVSDQNYYPDYIWLIFISILTVGYGDLYPETHGGRSIALLASLSGLVLSATLVGVINFNV